MMYITKKEAWQFFLWTLFAGALLGYTLGLIHQAIWKTKAMERERCEARQQHSW